MNISLLRSRAAGVVAAAAALVLLISAQAAVAAPARTATTTGYTTTTYLQDALGLPTSDTTPAIEPVTYDRFQWLLQQPGNLAILVGDPAEDSHFVSRAKDVETAAKAAGASKVYWFDPNLSGSAQVGGITEPNLDIRNPAGITSLAAASQTKYGNAWLSLVGQYLGNGLSVTQNGLNTENATVTVTDSPSASNDDGATAGQSHEVGNTSGGALYDYTSGSAPANVQHSYFFIYNKDHQDSGNAAKIVSWADLTAETGSGAAQADVTTAIDTVGASNLAELDQFAWWKSEVNAKEATQGSSVAQGANVPVLSDSDNTDGWRVNQITYPELVDLLASGAGSANAVILFGGTWCPNTRPVLPFVNKYAQQNNVQVFNFDTVLDGGLVGGGTTSASDPLQSRNTQNNGTTTPTGANPTFLYGDLVAKYLDNVKTEYDYSTGGPGVTYYPGGDTTGTVTSARKLQVPFLIGYGADGSGAGVKRQWIIDNGDGTYKEYMSDWWYTNPQPSQLGISATQLPASAPIWSTINSELANVTWQTDPSTLDPNSAIDTDDSQYLVDTDYAKVTYTAGPPASVTVASSTSTASGAVSISPSALSAALSALSPSAPANLAAAKTALINAEQASPQDQTQINNLTTVVGAWGVAQQRKSKVANTWGTSTSPASVVGGLAAVHALDVFFGGLPGGVVSRRTVTAGTVTYPTAPQITLAIANDYGRTPTGNVSLSLAQGGTAIPSASASQAVSDNTASFTLPVLQPGTYDYSLSYPGDDQIAGFTETGHVTVAPGSTTATTTTSSTTSAVTTTTTTKSTSTTQSSQGQKKITTTTKTAPKKSKVSKVKGAVAKTPTHKKGGSYKVTITVPRHGAAATGKVTIKLRKGAITKTFTGRLSRGAVVISLPKLPKGTWKVAITWPGDSHYAKVSVAGTSIKVTK